MVFQCVIKCELDHGTMLNSVYTQGTEGKKCQKV